MPFTIASKRRKQLGINQEGERLVQQKLQSTAGIKEDTKKWKHIPCSWMRRQYYEDVSITRVTYRFKAIPVKIPVTFFQNRKTPPKFTWNLSRPRIAKTILNKTKLEDSLFLVSNLTTKLQQPKQCDTGMADICTDGQNREPWMYG